MPFLYMLDPIDDWLGWIEIKREDIATVKVPTLVCRKVREALGCSTNEDIRQHEFVCLYYHGHAPVKPDDYTCTEITVAWKMLNNGTTFIYSPVRIPLYKKFLVS